MNDYRQIRYTKLKFTLQFTEAAELVQDKESAIRGGIGEMLLRAHCISDRNCETCGFREECIVQRVMYSRYKNLPPSVHQGDSVGYIIFCADKRHYFERGTSLSFTLTLFGNNIVYFNQYLNAVYSLGQHGLGKKKAHFQVVGVTGLRGGAILANRNIYMQHFCWETLGDYIRRRRTRFSFSDGDEQYITLRFLSLVSMKYQREMVNELNPEAIKDSLLRRLMILSCFENMLCEKKEENQPEEPFPEFQPLRCEQRSVLRYSSRHSERISLKGILGEAAMTNLSDDWLDLFLAGEITHIGKNTSFGFGKYRLFLPEYDAIDDIYY